MKRKLLERGKGIGKQVTAGACVIGQVALGFANMPWSVSVASTATSQAAPLERGSAGGVAAAPVTVNRTVPPVKPPKTGLELGSSPTPEEIFRARVFEEPLVPVGGQPTPSENAALATALLGYAQRASPDDFASLTGFLEAHPQSPWCAGLLTDLGLEYYNTAHYSLALDAWARGWSLAKEATDLHGKAIGDRAAGELAYMYARIGRMTELEAFLQSVEGREFVGPATEKISGARAGLWNMKSRPEIAFRCGPLALHRIKLRLDPQHPGDPIIYKSASTQRGFSLPQVAELSKQVGLDFQMAFREKDAAFVVPSVIHWKVGHYAALVRQEGGLYLLEDPTFQNDVWATGAALEAEASGYFLVPRGTLARGWRAVAEREGQSVWGKGVVCCNDPKPTGPCNPKKPSDTCPAQPSDCPAPGMAMPSAHLSVVSLNIVDEPVGYTPPVGPSVRFLVTYNQRDAFQPTTFTYANLGPKWTCHWVSYITDSPQSPLANVNYYIVGGGTRTFTGFDTNTQTFAFEQFDQTQLTRTGPATYRMLSPDGSVNVFSQSDGSTGTSRKVFLTQILDPAGNAVTLTYDANLRVVAITDTIGQVTTLTYGNTNDSYKITQVTDPFGRSAAFAYDGSGRLTNITDVIGISSQFTYDGASDFINTLTTPYGTTLFVKGENGTTRWLETVYPDGDRDRVEFNQSTNLGIPDSDSAQTVPVGMATIDQYLEFRNTYYWSKTACTLAYGDYTKARIYHWLHTADGASASGILESTKEPLENRVWNDYAGQSAAIVVGTNNRPSHIGRVLDDGTTQLYAYQYNAFGNLTQMIDPLGRTFTLIYDTNGIDLLETRMTRLRANELLSRTTYNAQHLPLTETDSAGQTTTYTYNARGQLLTMTNPKNETTSYTYDTNGYLLSVDGRLPGTNDTTFFTYDAFGRIETKTDETGYTLTFEYDTLDRLTKVIFPDATYDQYTYTRLDLTQVRDRAGRQTVMEYDPMGQLARRTDPLNRATLAQWCKCGDSKSLTDPMGRTTTWRHDVQGRVTSKEFADGSHISYLYENTGSRLRQRIDEKLQVTQYSYNRDDTLSGILYGNAAVPTPPVRFAYDPNYQRIISIEDGIGTTMYAYYPIRMTATLGAGMLASVSGPLPNETVVYGYDELRRRVSTTINGVAAATTYDAADRVIGATNALGSFAYFYEGSSRRQVLQTSPNGPSEQRSYANSLGDQRLRRITSTLGATLLSEFLCDYDNPAGRISSWSQQAGTQTPSIFAFGYDAVDRLTSASVYQGGNLVQVFGYGYDAADNRLTEAINGTTNTASYNALNQLTSVTDGAGTATTNQWDAAQHLISVVAGNQRTEFTYDGEGHVVGIRQLVNGSEISHRLFVWCGEEICEERTPDGVVSKRYFPQGIRIEAGAAAGPYYYTRDHLGSIREVVDAGGNVRARYTYDPFGRRTRVAGDVEADFGFAGMFWAAEAGLHTTPFRAYDAGLGRWLSRDPLKDAEVAEGPNLYAYVGDNPVNLTDPLGLKKKAKPKAKPKPKCCEREKEVADRALEEFGRCWRYRVRTEGLSEAAAREVCHNVWDKIIADAWQKLNDCLAKAPKSCKKTPDQCSSPPTPPPAPPPSPEYGF